jgi:hypothetical protein
MTSSADTRTFCAGSDTTRSMATVAVLVPRVICTVALSSGTVVPPAAASASSSRSPLAKSGTRRLARTSPTTETSCATWEVECTITCG